MNKKIYDRKARKNELSINGYVKVPIKHLEVLYESIVFKSRRVMISYFYIKNKRVHEDIYECKKEKGILQVNLAARKIENTKVLVDERLYCSTMGGYKLGPGYAKEYLIEVDYSVNIGAYYCEEQKKRALIKDKQLSYIYKKFDKFDPKIDFISYLRKVPNLERIVGAPFEKYYKQYQTISKHFNTLKKYTNLRYVASPKTILYCDKNKINPDTYMFVKINLWGDVSEETLLFYVNKYRYISSIKKDDKYKTEREVLRDYQDHILLCERSGKDINDKYWSEPKDFYARKELLLDEDTRKRQQLEKEELEMYNKGLLEHSNKLVLPSNTNYEYAPLKTIEEYRTIGKDLNICIYSNKYYEKVVDNKSIILACKVENQVVEVIEIDVKDFRLLQARSQNNGMSDYHDFILEELNKIVIPGLKRSFK